LTSINWQAAKDCPQAVLAESISLQKLSAPRFGKTWERSVFGAVVKKFLSFTLPKISRKAPLSQNQIIAMLI
jgi:hypothetical protein